MGIDDDGFQLEGGQQPSDVEGRGPGLQCDRSSRRQLVIMTQLGEPRGRRRHYATPEDRARLVLDYEHAVPAVHIKADVVGSHWAVLLRWMSGAPCG